MPLAGRSICFRPKCVGKVRAAFSMQLSMRLVMKVIRPLALSSDVFERDVAAAACHDSVAAVAALCVGTCSSAVSVCAYSACSVSCSPPCASTLDAFGSPSALRSFAVTAAFFGFDLSMLTFAAFAAAPLTPSAALTGADAVTFLPGAGGGATTAGVLPAAEDGAASGVFAAAGFFGGEAAAAAGAGAVFLVAALANIAPAFLGAAAFPLAGAAAAAFLPFAAGLSAAGAGCDSASTALLTANVSCT